MADHWRLAAADELHLHAAAVLLRRVLPDRAGAQRPGQVRPDDVGADRQQRGLDRRLRRSTCGSGATRRARSGQPFTDAAGLAAGARLDDRHRRADAGAAAVPEAGRLQLPSALRPEGDGARPHLPRGQVDGGLRRPDPARPDAWSPTWPPARRSRSAGAGGRRRLDGLPERLPGLDPAALAADGVAGHGDAAVRLPVRRRRRPCRGGGGDHAGAAAGHDVPGAGRRRPRRARRPDHPAGRSATAAARTTTSSSPGP